MDIISRTTLSNVDKFVESQMRALPIDELNQGLVNEDQKKFVPKFTVDGYGKWREVKGEQDISNSTTPCLRDSMVDVYKRLLHSKEVGISPFSRYSLTSRSPSSRPQIDSKKDSRPNTYRERPHTNASSQSYNHLSASLRSNIFPGVGKDKWQSSSKTTHNDEFGPTSWARPNENFAITKDEYMDWAEHDVYRQRLMKAWDKYIENAPKLDRKVIVQKRAREEENLKKMVKKEVKKKYRGKKSDANVKDEMMVNMKQAGEVQTKRIEVQPANSDEDFWDFYEKPFAQ